MTIEKMQTCYFWNNVFFKILSFVILRPEFFWNREIILVDEFLEGKNNLQASCFFSHRNNFLCSNQWTLDCACKKVCLQTHISKHFFTFIMLWDFNMLGAENVESVHVTILIKLCTGLAVMADDLWPRGPRFDPERI